MKEKLAQIKENFDQINRKTKLVILFGLAGVILFSVVLAAVMNHTSYAVLFSGLNTEEAQQIIAKLNEDGVEYQYKDDGTILTDEKEVDRLKAELVSEGYPKSGFTYDIFSSNADVMSTDSDKQTYLLYQLQDRIGATIRLFDGVKDAKVTIALGEENKYALSDEDKTESSATAVVIMKDNGSPDESQAEAIQRLVAKSVPDMEMENVAVFDGNGNEVTVNQDGTSGTGGEKSEEIAQIVEEQIAQRILNVLEPVYGQNAVRVSAKAKINMERLLREATTYTTPEKTDENDKTGIVSSETTSQQQSSGSTGTGAEGAAGTDSNSEVPEYTTQQGTSADTQNSESATREYLVNQLKEQGQIDPGTLEDLTVSVMINGQDFGSLSEDKLRELVGNAAGIAQADRAGKISVVCAPFYQPTAEEDVQEVSKDHSPVLLAAVCVLAGVLLLCLLILFLLMKKQKKRRKKEILQNSAKTVPERFAAVTAETKEVQKTEEPDSSMELRKNIREFTEKNPEIPAQLLRTWLNSGRGGE